MKKKVLTEETLKPEDESQPNGKEFKKKIVIINN